MLLNAIPRNFDEEIDESNNPAFEQDTQKFIKSEIDANYVLGIHAFDYASHFSKWEPHFLELDGKIASRESTASRAIQNLDDTMAFHHTPGPSRTEAEHPRPRFGQVEVDRPYWMISQSEPKGEHSTMASSKF